MATLESGRVVQSPPSFRLIGWGCASSTSLLAFTPCVTARFTRACFVDGQLAALDFRILQPCDGCLGLTGIRHLDKSKTAWPACFTVSDEIDAPYLTIGFEEFANFLWLGCKRNIAHKNLHTPVPSREGLRTCQCAGRQSILAGKSLGASRRLLPPPEDQE